MGHDVFISYSHDDKPVAEAMCHALESNGIRCWVAPRDVRPGMEYAAEIDEAINSCKVTVVVFSSHTNKSIHVPNEVERAISRGVPVVPFRVEDVAPEGALELFLRPRHWLDAITPPIEQHLERLADSIQSLLPTLRARPTSRESMWLKTWLAQLKKRAKLAAIILGTAFATVLLLVFIGLWQIASKSANAGFANAPPAQPAPAVSPLPIAGGYVNTTWWGTPVVVFSGTNQSAAALYGVTVAAVNDSLNQTQVFWQNVAVAPGQSFTVGPGEGWTWTPGERLVVSAPGYETRQWVYQP